MLQRTKQGGTSGLGRLDSADKNRFQPKHQLYSALTLVLSLRERRPLLLLLLLKCGHNHSEDRIAR